MAWMQTQMGPSPPGRAQIGAYKLPTSFTLGPKLILSSLSGRSSLSSRRRSAPPPRPSTDRPTASPIGRRHKPPSQRLALRPVSAEEGSCIIRRKEAVSAEEEAVSAEEAILTLLSSRNSFLVTPYTLSRALSTQRPRRPSWSSVLPAVSSLRRTASKHDVDDDSLCPEIPKLRSGRSLEIGPPTRAWDRARAPK